MTSLDAVIGAAIFPTFALQGGPTAERMTERSLSRPVLSWFVFCSAEAKGGSFVVPGDPAIGKYGTMPVRNCSALNMVSVSYLSASTIR